MRWTIFALGILLLAGFASATIPDDCDPAMGMVAYWQMEGDATDSFGNHDGIGYPDPISGFAVGDSARFTGTQMISIPDGDQALDCNSNFAIEFWMKKNIVAAEADAFLLNKANYNIKWTVTDTIEATVNGVTVTAGGLVPGNGYHVVLTWLGAAKNLSIYVNNDLKDTAELINPGVSSDALEIGEDFVGLIDEVAIYDTWFNEAEVEVHYKTSAGGKDYCYAAGAGDVSTSQTDFTLDGCRLPDGSSIAADSCSRNGMYYCGGVSLGFTLYDTMGTNLDIPSDGGCIMENDLYEPKTGLDRCCPRGYVCNDDLDDQLGDVFVCNLNPVDCVNITDQKKCDLNECFWLMDEGICVSNPLDYSCSIYKSNTSCNVDTWNVGAAGMGTEICGTYFVVDFNSEGKQGYVILMESCKCDWNSTTETEGNYCVLGYDQVPNVYSGDENRFRCPKSFDASECIDGLQTITWNAGPINLQGAWNIVADIPDEILRKAECYTDNVGIERSCGDPIIKMSGFSLFALISSLGIIGLVYLFKVEGKK